MPPLIVSLRIDDQHQSRLDDLRRRYFPAGRTQVGAHISLFHALPGECETDVHELLQRVAQREPFDVRVAEVMSLGRGAALRLRSADLDAVHAELRRALRDVLTAQDAQPFRAHVTIQNKVTPDVAARTVDTLKTDFAPYDLPAVGLSLWHYAGGPWHPVAAYAFATTG